MNFALQFVRKHKTLFIVAGLALVVWQVWLYYRALQQAKALGQGIGEGAKGTVSGVASILTAPARILATAAANVVDFFIGEPLFPDNQASGLSYDQTSGRFQVGDVSISRPSEDIPGTVTYPWSRN